MIALSLVSKLSNSLLAITDILDGVVCNEAALMADIAKVGHNFIPLEFEQPLMITANSHNDRLLNISERLHEDSESDRAITSMERNM